MFIHFNEAFLTKGTCDVSSHNIKTMKRKTESLRMAIVCRF